MKNKVFGLLAVGVALGFTACNNSGSTSATNDSTGTNTTTTNTATSSGNYAARADSVNTNVTAGNYLNPRTGKAYSKLNVDQSTGAVTDESGRPVRRYVDKRTWWVYDTNKWDTVGSAQMNGNNLMYRGDNGDWMQYDKRWTDDADMSNTDSSNSTSGMSDASGDNNTKVSDHGNKVKDDNTKVKVSDNGNKLKVKKTGKQ